MSAEFITADPFAGLPHGFFTRRGGVSGGGFATLNCSLSGKDDPERVATNRGRAMAALGLPASALSGAHQVHGIEVAEVTAPIPNENRPRADALVTRVPGLALGVVTADCGPVLFADRQAGVVGAAHAGWRGAVAGMLEATLVAMERLGARRTDIAAVVGPCIRQNSYEVGADLRDAVLAQSPEAERFLIASRRPGRWMFDLPGYCAARLVAAGTGRVGVIAADTCADAERFFSHRRRTLNNEGPIGHQLSAIALPA
ncbi:peptidoglycan editing factor PgeF [Teichococcus vastitatis]|uniref:Purine nucleoside phosphorylase n=1 Tax=Teichococcus vastitatis TaxID=2307076 RepID=A0ABS9W4N4_9PROT|nr:peptidoglycan editing factor PgeF [Pseudoroseomonas vastitatis]MCI0754168.1 peptidoglycan editing factor PgeF [Pseudoroseomonas vastitatis]